MRNFFSFFFSFYLGVLTSTLTYKINLFLAFFCSTISEIVDEALKEGKASFVDDDESVNSVFWSILREDGLDIRDKKSAIIDFIAAGIETFANTLIFILHYVTENDGKHLEKIFEEFKNCSETIEATDLTKAVYTKACLQETYRICPTAFCLARILYEDTALSGYHLKAGVSTLNISTKRFKFLRKCSIADVDSMPKYDCLS